MFIVSEQCFNINTILTFTTVETIYTVNMSFLKLNKVVSVTPLIPIDRR